MQRVLQALEPIREQVGRIGMVGHGWDSPPPWTNPTLIEDAYRSDPGYLRRLNIEISPPIHFDQVIGCMGKGTFTPVIYRPLFNHLQFVTCRTFETPAANTIPLFGLDEAYVEEVYGERALELMLGGERPHEKILDILSRPEHYGEIVMEIRRHLAERHSYAMRVQELIDIVES